MNEDYLWDKSGEPDPQIQELEQILAPLRYQPKPLELPNEFSTGRQRNYLPLAIAATVLIALLITGMWLRLRKQNIAQPQQALTVPSVVKEEPPAPTPEVAKNTKEPKKPVRRRHKPVFTKQEREEALAAKQQLMLALRLASEKLKMAQRRTQAPQGPTPNQIKNQHRVG